MIRTCLRLLFFETLHIGPLGAAAQHTGELRQLLVGPGGINFHAAIVQIAGIAGQTQTGGGPLREIAEPHTLNAASDEPAPGRMLGHSAERIAWSAPKTCHMPETCHGTLRLVFISEYLLNGLSPALSCAAYWIRSQDRSNTTWTC